jgi:hypothetical protein
MAATMFIFATVLLHLTISVATVVIVVLVLLLWRSLVLTAQFGRQCARAQRERNEARKQLATLRRMSEIRLDVVARLAGFGREP